jgi:hypothetical protein
MSATFTIEIEDKGGPEPPMPPPAPSVPWPGRPAPFDMDPPYAPPMAPRAGGGSGGGESDRVSAFDRPIAAIIMGPKPLPVAVVSGIPAGLGAGKSPAMPRPKKPEEGWGKFLFDRAANAAKSANVALPAAARNAGMPALSEAAGSAAAALGRLGPYGLAAGAALLAAGAGAKAFTDSVNAFVERGRELAGINGQLSAAATGADMLRMQSDYREADVLGDKLSAIIENQAKWEATFREIALPVKAFILDVLNDIMKGGMEVLIELLEIAKDVADKLPLLAGAAARIDGTLKKVKEIMEGGAAVDGVGTWLKDLGKFVAPPPGRPAPLPVPFFPG